MKEREVQELTVDTVFIALQQVVSPDAVDRCDLLQREAVAFTTTHRGLGAEYERQTSNNAVSVSQRLSDSICGERQRCAFFSSLPAYVVVSGGRGSCRHNNRQNRAAL